jgi:hypothetical protein
MADTADIADSAEDIKKRRHSSSGSISSMLGLRRGSKDSTKTSSPSPPSVAVSSISSPIGSPPASDGRRSFLSSRTPSLISGPAPTDFSTITLPPPAIEAKAKVKNEKGELDIKFYSESGNGQFLSLLARNTCTCAVSRLSLTNFTDRDTFIERFTKPLQPDNGHR